jgi:hypothetical protein
MDSQIDAARQSVILFFPDGDALAAFLDRPRERGLKARLLEGLAEGSEWTLVLTSPGGRIDLTTRVRQVYRSGVDRWGTVFDVLDWSPLDASLASQAGSSSDLASVEPGPEEDEKDGVSTQGTAPIFAIKEMNPAERRRLATKADRNQRQVLLRDSSPQVLMGLLSNPRIETKEIIQLIKNPQVSGGILKMIADNRQYTSNYEVQLALVRNVKTPTPIAVRLVEFLRINDLRDMAKGKGVSDDVKTVALRVYLRRSSQ